jgi:hypothetical protein
MSPADMNIIGTSLIEAQCLVRCNVTALQVPRTFHRILAIISDLLTGLLSRSQ